MTATRRRVLFMIDDARSSGGAERLSVELAARLPQDRFEPWLCATRSMDGWSTATLDVAGVRHITLGRRGKWDVHRFGGLVSALRSRRFEILHTHKFGSNAWGAVIGTACRVPVIVAHEHTWSYEGDPVRVLIDGQVIGRLADRFIAVSSADGRRMVSIEKVDPRKVVVIPNGYVPRPRSDVDIRAELGLAGAPIVASAAVMRRQKRIDLILDAFARARADVPDAQLVLAGDGECRAELEAQAATLGIDRSVHFLGLRSDVDAILRAADVAVVASDYEGSSLFVFECLAAGTPLVCTDVGDVPDVIVDGVTGVIVRRRDLAGLADGIVGLLTDPERRARIAAAAAASATEYTIDATARRLTALYESLV